MRDKVKSKLAKLYFPIQFILLGLIVYNVSFLFLFNIDYFKQGPVTEYGKELRVLNDIARPYSIVVISSQNLGENQQGQYTCIAANNLGWDCHLFSFDERVINYDVSYYYMSVVKRLMNYYVKPDFVFYINPSLVLEKDEYPNYGTLDIINYDIMRYRETGLFDPSYLKWLSKFSGFLLFGYDSSWFENLRKELSSYYYISDKYVSGFFPSVFHNQFKSGPRNNLFYGGAIWDNRRGSRHFKDIYIALDKKKYLHIYGPLERWSFLQNSYKGEIYKNPMKYLEAVRETGISLVLHHELNLKHGIISQRLFEAAAANNIVISDENSMVKKVFGDCVYYINPDEEVELVVKKIDNIINQVQSNSQDAEQRARCIYDIYCKEFTIEKQLVGLIKIHEGK